MGKGKGKGITSKGTTSNMNWSKGNGKGYGARRGKGKGKGFVGRSSKSGKKLSRIRCVVGHFPCVSHTQNDILCDAKQAWT